MARWVPRLARPSPDSIVQKANKVMQDFTASELSYLRGLVSSDLSRLTDKVNALDTDRQDLAHKLAPEVTRLLAKCERIRHEEHDREVQFKRDNDRDSRTAGEESPE